MAFTDNGGPDAEAALDVLVIEDDADICKVIRRGWPVPGDALRFASSYGQSIHLVHGPELATFDCVVIDLHLPDGDGLSILRTIRKTTDVPIVLISGSGTADSRAEAFDIGADDYVMKPFSVRELQARVSRLVSVRRGAQRTADPDVYRIGDLVCHVTHRYMEHADERIDLTDAETRLLRALCEKRPYACAKTFLYKTVFFRPYNPGDKTLDVYISRLRKKIRALGLDAEDLIQTARGTGYRAIDP